MIITGYEVKAFDYEAEEFVPTPAYEGTVAINEPGAYYFYLMNNRLDSDYDIGIYIIVEGKSDSATGEPVTENEVPTIDNVEPATEIPQQTTENAVPTTSTVLVNGTPVEFDAYKINGNNYFKLRDLALAVNYTEKNFEVTWDEEKNAINLISNSSYTPVGGELEKGDGTVKVATLSTSKIYKDGDEISLTAYKINGNNYFKLRDIAKAFDIGVIWDSETNTVIIDTSISYVEE